MADKPIEPRSLDTITNPAEPLAPAPTGAEALGRAMERERDLMLAALRQMRSRLEGIAADTALPPELLPVADRALSDLAAAETRCLGQRPSFLSVTDLAATVGAVEKLTASLARDTAAARERANSPENQQHKLRASVAAMHHDLFEKKIFDPYLRFDSASEEEEYRKRERERKEEIERLQKIGTPDALKQANALVGEQLKDAEQHGAGASPHFDRLMQQQQQLKQDFEMTTGGPKVVIDDQVDSVAALLREAGVAPATDEKSATLPPLALAHGQSIIRG